MHRCKYENFWMMHSIYFQSENIQDEVLLEISGRRNFSRNEGDPKNIAIKKFLGPKKVPGVVSKDDVVVLYT